MSATSRDKTINCARSNNNVADEDGVNRLPGSTAR